MFPFGSGPEVSGHSLDCPKPELHTVPGYSPMPFFTLIWTITDENNQDSVYFKHAFHYFACPDVSSERFLRS